MITKLVAVIATGITLSSSPWSACAVPYQIIDLGGHIGYDVNNNGQVVGIAAPPPYSAFLYSGGVLGQLGGNTTHAYAINNSGDVVGSSASGAFLYSGGSLQFFGGAGGVAYGLSDNGYVTGRINVGNGSHAFLHFEGNTVDLGTLGGAHSQGSDVNSSGQAVGISDSSTGSIRAFLYENGVMKDIGDMGGYAYAEGINEAGHIGGYGLVAPGEIRAFLYKNGVMQQYGTLGGHVSGAYDVNNFDQMVGGATTPNDRSVAALFLNGNVYDLNSLIDPNLGWDLSIAFAISDSGYITGQGNIGGHDRAFLLVPTGEALPEPTHHGLPDTSTGIMSMLTFLGLLLVAKVKRVDQGSLAPARGTDGQVY